MSAPDELVRLEHILARLAAVPSDLGDVSASDRALVAQLRKAEAFLRSSVLAERAWTKAELADLRVMCDAAEVVLGMVEVARAAPGVCVERGPSLPASGRKPTLLN